VKRLLLFLLLASPLAAQVTTQTTETITSNGSGYLPGATVTQNGVACTVVSNIGTQVVSQCPLLGTIVVKNPTYNYTLGGATSLSFSWKQGTAAPAAQSLSVFDTSPCPPVSPQPMCHWPITLSSDSAWLTVTPNSGSTTLTSMASVNAAGLKPGSYTAHITASVALFATAPMSIPVTLTVTAPAHSVTLTVVPAQQGAGVSISSFNILKGTAKGGPFTQLVNLPAATLKPYTDTAVTAGQTYFYEADAVATNGKTSAATVPVSATVPSP
jgi:hypothetical protein